MLEQQTGDAASMMTPEMLADRFEGGPSARTLADRAREDRTWTFGHAVVDEAQELSPMQWRLVARRVPLRSMTVVGDVAQTGSAAGTTAWADVLDTVAEGRWRLEELTVNYRTPAEVMELATALLEAHGIAVKPPRSAREATWPPSAAVLVPGGEPRGSGVRRRRRRRARGRRGARRRAVCGGRSRATATTGSPVTSPRPLRASPCSPVASRC